MRPMRAPRQHHETGAQSPALDVLAVGAGVAAVAAVTVICRYWLDVSNAATVSAAFLLVVLVVAATARLWAAVATSIAAVVTFNFFFLPPVGTLTIADPQNWVALLAFLAVSLIASQLSAAARTRATEAAARRDELARLFDLSRDILVMTDDGDARTTLARSVARRFHLSVVAMGLPASDEWTVFHGGTERVDIETREWTTTFAAAQATLEFDAHERTYAGHRIVTAGGHTFRLVPLRVGTRPIGVLATTGRTVEPGTLDTLAGLVAIAIERAELLEERKAAEVTRQSEALKTALLASLGHDLRTPLTAIRVAADNLQSSSLPQIDREDQAALIVVEVARLTRLFDNILEMARIDAGGVAAEARWTHPSEIVEAARAQVEPMLRGHTVTVTNTHDVPVLLDPRLTATALARVLENTAQYAPAHTPIDIQTAVTHEGLTVRVRDSGHGIAATDLPRLFDRFYRGAAAATRPAGTGMGLSIVRGLLDVVGGRVWAENAEGGGARFTIVIPAAVKDAVDDAGEV